MTEPSGITRQKGYKMSKARTMLKEVAELSFWLAVGYTITSLALIQAGL